MGFSSAIPTQCEVVHAFPSIATRYTYLGWSNWRGVIDLYCLYPFIACAARIISPDAQSYQAVLKAPGIDRPRPAP